MHIFSKDFFIISTFILTTFSGIQHFIKGLSEFNGIELSHNPFPLTPFPRLTIYIIFAFQFNIPYGPHP